MQLFITDYEKNNNIITLSEERVVHQLAKVLRAKKWDQCAVQRWNTRVVCTIEDIQKKSVTAEILYEETFNGLNDRFYLAVAMPNKFEKLELIVQKCAEIGITDLIFFPAKHSILKEISESKMDRLKKISLEAVEQSRWRKNLSTSFEKNIFSLCENKKLFVAHQKWEEIQNYLIQQRSGESNDASILMVWPEGWRHADEENLFEKLHMKKISFGENILRTETAAIIWWRIVKNFL